MATTSSATSLDPAYLAQQYTALDRASKDTLLSNQYNKVNAQLKGFTALKTSLSNFSDSLSKMLKDDNLLASSATVSDADVAAVTVDGTAAAGTYELYVEQLAQAHQLALAFDTDTTLPTSGDLGITVAGKEFAVDLSSLQAGASLSDLAKLINNSADNSGVTASVMRSGDKNYLVLTSDESGADNAISLNFNGTGDAASTTFSSAVASVQELAKAQNAIVKLGSSSTITINSSSNKLEGVIDGVTIDLKKAQNSTDGAMRITVAEDTDKTAENVQSLVTDYNNLLKQLSGDDIKNDSMSSSIKRVLRSSFQGMFDGKTLYSIGIEFDKDGTMTLDSDKLANALESNSTQVAAMLTGDNGVLAKLQTSLKPYSDRFGFLKTKVDNLQTSLDKVTKKQEDFDTKMTSVYQRYLKQFTQMQITISQLESSMSSFSS